MVQELVDLLETEYGFPVFKQGSLNPDEPYPATFFTFWNDETSGAAFYDNDARSFVWGFLLSLYSSDPAIVNTTLPAVRTFLRSHGWIVEGIGFDATSDEPTHTGRAINIHYIQKNTLIGG